MRRESLEWLVLGILSFHLCVKVGCLVLCVEGLGVGLGMGLGLGLGLRGVEAVVGLGPGRVVLGSVALVSREGGQLVVWPGQRSALQRGVGDGHGAGAGGLQELLDRGCLALGLGP